MSILHADCVGETYRSIMSCILARATLDNIFLIMLSSVIGRMLLIVDGFPFCLLSVISIPSPISSMICPCSNIWLYIIVRRLHRLGPP